MSRSSVLINKQVVLFCALSFAFKANRNLIFPPQSAVTHKKITTAPNSISFNWVAPKGLSENVVMTCTIALNGGVFWVKERAVDALRVN